MSRRRIEVLDTIRDMTQSPTINLTPEQRLAIARVDAALGIHIAEVGFPESSGNERKTFELMQQHRDSLFPLLHAAFGKTHKPGIQPSADPGMHALAESQAPVIVLFGKASDHFARESLGIDAEQNLRIISASIIHMINQTGARLIFDGEMSSDGWRDNPDYLKRVIETAFEAGADTFVYCDTVGTDFPVPHEADGRRQTGVYEMFQELRREFGWDGNKRLGYHGHNDRDCATANAIAAVSGGADHVHVTHSGHAERTGMGKLASVVMGVRLAGFEVLPEDRYELLTPSAKAVSRILNVSLPRNEPYVGGLAFAHKAGVHHSANSKSHKGNRGRVAYEHIPPVSVGNQSHVVLSSVAGASTIHTVLDELHASGSLSSEVIDILRQPDNIGVMLFLLKQQSEKGISFEEARTSYLLRCLEKLQMFTPYFQLLRTHWVDDSKTGVRASVSIAVHGSVELTYGNWPKEHEEINNNNVGQVDAASKALLDALEKHFDGLENIRLVHYAVHDITSEGTASTVQVEIKFTDGEEEFCTTGVDSNVIHASQAAHVDAVNYFLLKKEMKAHDVSP